MFSCLFRVILIMLLGASIPSAWAQMTKASLKVRKIKVKSGSLLLKGRHKIKKGQRLNIQFSVKRTCVGHVSKIKKSLVLVKAYDCPYFKDAGKGDLVSLIYNPLDPPKKRGWPKEFVVYHFDEAKKTISTLIPKKQKLKKNMQFNLFARDNNFCPVRVIRVNRKIAYGDVSKCTFLYEIQPDLKLELKEGVGDADDIVADFEEEEKEPEEEEPVVVEKSKSKKKRKLKTLNFSKNESSYILFGFGIPKISYSNETDKSNVEALKNNTAVTHIPLAFDLFGYYIPMKDKKTLYGGVVNIIRDAFSGTSTTFEIYQMMFAGSMLKFLGVGNVGSGLFIRGDLGLVRYTSTAVKSSTDGSVTEPSKTGFGLTVGGGYGLPVSNETRALAGLNFSYRKAGDSTMSNIMIMLDFLY